MGPKSFKLAIYMSTALALPFHAFAQDSDGSDFQATDEIIVTAQKREQSILEVPVAVQIVDSVFFEQNQGANIRDLVKLTPSLQLTSGFNIAGGNPSIRGVGTAAFGQASEPSVLVVVDGVPRLRSDQNFSDLIDLERVEVLKGAQSTLFGRGASAGVVNIVTKTPGQDFEGRIDALVAEDNEYRIRGYVSGPVSENLAASLAVAYRESGDWIDNANDTTVFPDASTTTIRGRVAYAPSDNFEVVLSGDYNDTNSNSLPFLYIRTDSPILTGAIAPVVASEDNRTANVQGDLVFTNTESYGGDVTARLSMDAFDLVSTTSYREFVFSNNNDVDGTPDTGAGGPGFLTLNRSFGDELDKIFTQEFRVESTGDNLVDYTAGVYFDRNDIVANIDRTICIINIDCAKDFRIPLSPTFSIPGAILTETIEALEQDSISIFGQATVAVSESFDLTMGARWQKTDTESVTTDLIANTVESREFDDDGWSGKIAGQYYLSDASSLYASYAHGYKGATSSTLDPTIPIVDPETSDNFELGYKGTFGRSNLFVTGFFSKFQDFQAQGLTPITNDFILTNVGEVETKGIEVDFNSRISDQLSVNVAGAWIDAEITSYPNGQCFTPLAESALLFPGCGGPTPTADLTGGVLPNSPEFKVNANARYEDDLPYGGLRGFAQINVSWQDDVQYSLSQNPNTVQDSYSLTDLTVGIMGPADRYTASIFMKNAFDKNYLSFIAQNALVGSSVNLWGIPARDSGRYIGANVAVNF